MTNPNQINHTPAARKKNWKSPKVITIAASQIKGYPAKTIYPNSGAIAVALPADTLRKPVTLWHEHQVSVQQPVAAVAKKTPRIGILRFAAYCLLLIVMLPLFLLDAKRSSH
ncbi:hypothetical protein ACFGVR_10510 [Mucilaginibacter sp. AW1-3]